MPTLHIPHPEKDISELLFRSRDHDANKKSISFGSSSNNNDKNKEYYVGPIEVTSKNVRHGLGVIASRDVQQGECLFVIKAAVSANVDEVYKEWRSHDDRMVDDAATSTSNQTTTTTLLEHLAEQSLIKAMRQKMMMKKSTKDRCIVQSFLLQLSSGADEDVDQRKTTNLPKSNRELMAALVGNGAPMLPPKSSSPPQLDDQKLLEIIRRNAFGPDFVSYEKLEHKWKAGTGNLPSRLLGLYPLAAMINHSCVPNALRVFANGDYMIVHASGNIKQGQEIVWSYLPPIQPYPTRYKQLKEHHGFACKCIRCQNEQQAAECNTTCPNIYEVPDEVQALYEETKTGSNNNNNDDESINRRQQYTNALSQWEKDIFASSSSSSSNNKISNETKRYWKMGNANLYIHNLNVQLMNIASQQITTTTTTMQQQLQQLQAIRNQVLMQAMELHFCFVSCHYASTEHLSVMHLCYELVAVIHSSQSTPEDQSKTLPKVKFWTEQLKRAHLVRYGPLGGDINRVRAIMKHTQMVLRHQNGIGYCAL